MAFWKPPDAAFAKPTAGLHDQRSRHLPLDGSGGSGDFGAIPAGARSAIPAGLIRAKLRREGARSPMLWLSLWQSNIGNQDG